MRYASYRELHTPRLQLRRFRMEDVPCFFERLGGNAQVTQYMLWQPHRDISQSEVSIRKVLRQYESGRAYCWAIAEKDTGELIGRIDLLCFDEQSDSCQFAYMLGADFWNRGYGTEAVKAVFDFAFRELEMQSIAADHMAENPASGAVMRKAGMIQWGIQPKKYEKNGILHDAVQYRITKEDWENR